MKILRYLFVWPLLIPMSLLAQQAAWELVRENFWGAIAIDPTNPGIIYVSPGNSQQFGLHKSMDGGKTWVYYDIKYGPGIDGGIVIDPNNPQRLWIYGGPFKGLVRSEDGGMTVVRADTGISFDHHGYSVRALVYDHVRNILYAGDDSLIPGGIYRSFDGGRRWELVHAYGRGLMFDPAFFWVYEDSGWVYSGTSVHGIWRSKDLGVTWTPLHPEVLAGQPIAFIANVPNSRTLYAVGGRGKIFKSYDLGENWINISTMDSTQLVGGLIISSLDSNYIYVGSRAHGSVYLRGGFFMSRDGGKNWELYHVGLPQYELRNYDVRSIAQSPDSKYIYMSLPGVPPPENKVYRLSQSLLTSVHEHSRDFVPSQFLLQQNYPNPFNSQTRIEFSISKKSLVSLAVYSITGEYIVSLFGGPKEAGSHFVTWNGKNLKGGDVSSGIYLIRLQAGRDVLIRKILLIR